jgi:hypothetical protein
MRANKRKIHHHLKRIAGIKTWQLLVLLLVMLFVSATLLRLNNLGMIEKREAVIQADKKLDDAAVQKALVDLQRYVSSHMNTSLNKGVYRENAYNRDRDAALEAASNASNPNSAAYQQASIECRSRFRGGVESFRNDYVQCVLERVSAMGAGQDPASSIHLPKADLYRYDFVSPLWTPDAAGFAVLFTLLIALLLAIRGLNAGAVHLLLKSRHKHNYS